MADKYTVKAPFEYDFGNYKVGPWFQLQGDGGLAPIVGDYCCWPKQEVRTFVVDLIS